MSSVARDAASERGVRAFGCPEMALPTCPGERSMPRNDWRATVGGAFGVALACASSVSAQAAARCETLCLAPARMVSFETRQGTRMGVSLTPDGKTIVFD